MSELTDYLVDRFLRNKNSETKEMMQRQKVKNAIQRVCDDKLTDINDILTFEVAESDLQYATEVIMEEPIVTKYEIDQVSSSLFKAKLREVDF